MYNIELQWKEFSVDLELLYVWIKTQTDKCLGVSANSKLELHFSEEPEQSVKDAIANKWNEMNEDAPEVVNYRSAAQIKDIIEAAKLAMTTSAMNKWTAAERKLFMGMPLSKEDILALEDKHV
jgi:hypothetical protein